MENENTVNPDTEVQDADGANSETNASVTQSEKEKAFEDQKRRAEKAEREKRELEEKLKALTTEQPKEQKPKETQSALSRDEAILYAKGLTEEQVEYAKKVAQVNDVPLTEAINDDLFITWKTKQEQKAKSEAAQVGASKGSGGNPKAPDFKTPGLSKEDHKALWKKQFGR